MALRGREVITMRPPPLHMKDLWRARSSGIVSLGLHRHPSREDEGAQMTCL